jgi:FtsP/CotA-like multicopper oxidase with cupredoxin domain
MALNIADPAAPVTLTVQSITKTMSDGNNLVFWVFCQRGVAVANCTLPGPLLELGAGQQANVTLNFMGSMMGGGNMPFEPAPYQGHTIHTHGLDVPQVEDGVPETGAAIMGDIYSFNVNQQYIGSHMYHCHVHTVKHLEMGMYGALLVRAVDAQGSYLTFINDGGPSYDEEWNWILSTVDPSYHTAQAIGDNVIFADYNPAYFLINGNEGLNPSAPAEIKSVFPGAVVAIRLMGMQSVNATFKITDANNIPQSFEVHNIDGFKLPAVQTVSKLDISPGQSKDILVKVPNQGGTSWHPQITYSPLRGGSIPYTNGTVYTTLEF